MKKIEKQQQTKNKSKLWQQKQWKINVQSVLGITDNIDECEDLKKLMVDQRSKTFFKKKPRYGCCKPINDGYITKSCKK